MASLHAFTGLFGSSDRQSTSLPGASRAWWPLRLAGVWVSRSAHCASAPAALATPEKTVFVLLGGGARGAAQAGALAAVLEQGVYPDALIGVSAGAWNGAYLAVNPTPERARNLCAIWASLHTSDVLGGGWWRAAVSAFSGRSSLYGAEGSIQVGRRYLEQHTFAELQVPLSILAMNLTTGQPHLFESGWLLPAVLASSAVPGLFPPVVLDGQVYVDGGLLEWETCLAALRLGAGSIYVFGCGSLGERSLSLALAQNGKGHPTGTIGNGKARKGNEQPAEPRRSGVEQNLATSLLEVLERSWDVVSRYQFQRVVEGVRAGGARIIPIDPQLPPGSRALDFSQSEALIAAGRAAALATLAHRLETQPATA